jgi:tetratricopeptide (TPR) repeat protein
MGAVYRSMDLETGATVALKVMEGLDANASARFHREAAILSELRHPGIVRYVARGTTSSGVPYLAMEWLEGEDLAERIARGPLGVEESLTLLRRACEALAVPHSRGIVHRDLKPANLFLERCRPERVKVLDFGVARYDGTTSLSTGATLLGTVGYMAPEQALCEQDVDVRADVFALGCVLYECLTGKAPFASAHPVGVLAKVLREDPPRPSELRPGVPPLADALVSHLLAKDRRERPTDAGAVLEVLDALREGNATPEPAPRRAGPVLRGSEQRVISVILGRRLAPAPHGPPGPGDGEVSIGDLSDRYAADVAELQGRAILLVLSGKGPASDRASRAAECALELRRVRPDLDLAVATGLADTSERIPMGAAIDRAAALLDLGLSTAQGVPVDDVTSRLVGLRFDVQQEGRIAFVTGVRRDLAAPALLLGRPIPCLGRDRDLAMLDAVLEECVADSVSRAVLVTGPPGIGKSRLASEWLRRLSATHPLRALVARSDPGSAGSAFALVRQLVRRALGLREDAPPEVQRALLRDHLPSATGSARAAPFAEFLGELAGLWGETEPSPLLGAARRNPEIMREQVRRALHAWLDAETASAPLVVVLEDLHWGDTPSVAFLVDALAEKPERPLMILALARPEAERQFPDLSAQATLRLRLPGLTARTAEELVRSALERPPPASVVQRIIRTADGNPFYLEELIRQVATGNTEWPDTVLAMAQSRIEQLDADARRALRAASVFGETFWELGVQVMLGHEHEARPLLDALARHEFVVPVPETQHAGAREYRFRHALLRDAAYAMMTAEDRCAAHAAAGEWLEGRNEPDPRVLADHYQAAGQHARAQPWLIHAAKAALDAGDFPATVELANRGVALGARGVERGRLLLLRGYVEALCGQPDLNAMREALDLLAVGTAAWWLGLSVLIFGACMRGKPEEAAPYVRLASDAPFASGGDVPFGQGLTTLVGGLVLLGKGAVAQRILEQIERAAPDDRSDPVFDAFLEASWCSLAAVAPIGGRWQIERALCGGREAAAALGRLGAIHGESIALDYVAVAAMHVGRYEEALDASARSAQRRAALGINNEWPLLFLAKAHLRLDQPDDALSVVTALRSSPDWTVQQMLPVIVGEARLRKGDLVGAIEEVSPACEGVSPRLRRLAACVRARAELALGTPDRALVTVEQALAQPTSDGLESGLDLLALRAEALHAGGRPEAARQALESAIEVIRSIADDISDADLRRSYLERVEPCARALALSKAWSQGAGAKTS